MIAIIDYGAGNVESVRHALERIGEGSILTHERETILQADGVILPGVGAFGEAMRQLRCRGLMDTLRKLRSAGTPFLGICIGLQLLFEKSEESKGVCGLKFLPGEVKRIEPQADVKVPHMGWNQPEILHPDPLLEGLGDSPWFYFVHSYYACAADPSQVVAKVHLGQNDMDVFVRDGSLWAVQFHPEKSGEAGLKLLKNFAAVCRKEAHSDVG